MDMIIRTLGLVDYATGLAIQSETATEVREKGQKGIVLVLRHPPTITLGRRTDDCEVHATAEDLEGMGISLHRVDRGGGATFHYPGQSVVYPILSISRTGLDVDGVLDSMGSAVTTVLEGFGISATWDRERPGAYVDGAKIASVGLHLSRDVITHGMALNVGPGLDGFHLIDPCKEAGLRVTSLSDLVDVTPDPDAVGTALAEAFVRSIGAAPARVAGRVDFN